MFLWHGGVTTVSYTLPDFNLICNLYTNATGIHVAARLSPPCNLAYSRRVQVGTSFSRAQMSLLVPAGTDIRGPQSASNSDWVEVPAGSGRIYGVQNVDDAGKGFLNEHRVALIEWSTVFGPWPTPIP